MKQGMSIHPGVPVIKPVKGDWLMYVNGVLVRVKDL